MKRIVVSCIAIALTGILPSFAEETGTYSRFEAGISTFNGIYGLDTGYSLSGAIGYKINTYVGVEGEIGYTDNQVIFGLGRLETVPVLGNLVLTAPVGDVLSVNFGVGGGYGFVSANTWLGSASGNGFIGQAKAGISAKISDSVSANLGYAIRSDFSPISQNIFSGGLTIKF